MAYMGEYFIRVGDALSQLCNVAFLNGHPNESLSGRAWRTKSIWYKFIDWVFWFDKNHCQSAYDNDLRYARNLLSDRQHSKKC
jgi:hypothetical protein